MPLIEAEPYQLSREAQAFVDAINTRHHAAAEAKFDSDRDKQAMDTADAMTVNLEQLQKSRAKWKRDRVGILREYALTIRELEKWAPKRRSERRRAYDAAAADQLAAAQEIVRLLETIGYENVGPDGVFVQSHPKVIEVSDRVRALFWMREEDFNFERHQRDLDTVEAELADLLEVPAVA